MEQKKVLINLNSTSRGNITFKVRPWSYIGVSLSTTAKAKGDLKTIDQ